MNYLIVLEYCGTNYNGWQAQNDNSVKKNKTIEDEILKAIYAATKCGTKLSVSGRTDAGVHALNQVANFRLPFYYDLDRFKISLNGILPSDISVKNLEIVHDSFHATHDALSKTYLYKINSGYKSPILSDGSWFVKEELNFDIMSESAAIFSGRNNFFNFTKKEKGKNSENYFRVVMGIKICRKNYGFDIFVEGEGFLRHMVRRIAGGIVLCGAGKMSLNNIKRMLAGEKGAYGSVCAPPCGLFLYSVSYRHKIYC